MNDQEKWLKQMADLQQQYWNGVRDMAGQAAGQNPPPASNTPWQNGLDAWNRAMGAASGGSGFGAPAFGAAPFGTAGFGVPGFGGNASVGGQGGFGQNEVVERMLAHGKQYLELLQGMATGQGFQSGPNFDPRKWIGEMRSLHERFGESVMGANLGSVPWFGGIDQTQIEQMVKSFTGSPLRGMQQEWQAALGVPAFGLAREHQERSQTLLRDWLDYQVTTQRYNDLMMKSTQRTFDVLESKLAQREEPGRQIESARALYDLWIDAAEESFAEIAMSPEYRSIYGELVNGQMKVRAGLNGEIERMGAQFGLPTRTEVDSLAKQVHDLKRELRRVSSAAVGPSTSSNDRGADTSSTRPPAPVARLAAVRKARSGIAPASKTGRTNASAARKSPSTKSAPAGKPASSAGSDTRRRSAPPPSRTAAAKRSRPVPATKRPATTTPVATKKGSRAGDDTPVIQSTARTTASRS
jgi:class III poly(R)-hydroxyalkanoic acid synthase PhaE subunit